MFGKLPTSEINKTRAETNQCHEHIWGDFFTSSWTRQTHPSLSFKKFNAEGTKIPSFGVVHSQTRAIILENFDDVVTRLHASKGYLSVDIDRSLTMDSL